MPTTHEDAQQIIETLVSALINLMDAVDSGMSACADEVYENEWIAAEDALENADTYLRNAKE